MVCVTLIRCLGTVLLFLLFFLQTSFFAVYDGHGGPEVVDYLSQSLHRTFCLTEAYAKNGKLKFGGVFCMASQIDSYLCVADFIKAFRQAFEIAERQVMSGFRQLIETSNEYRHCRLLAGLASKRRSSERMPRRFGSLKEMTRSPSFRFNGDNRRIVTRSSTSSLSEDLCDHDDPVVQLLPGTDDRGIEENVFKAKVDELESKIMAIRNDLFCAEDDDDDEEGETDFDGDEVRHTV